MPVPAPDASNTILEAAASDCQMIENLFSHLAGFFLRGYFFEHGIFQQLLLNEIGELERSHLQHLDALAQLRRQHESLR